MIFRDKSMSWRTQISTQPAKNVVIIRILQVPVPDPAAHAPGSTKIHQKAQSDQAVADPWTADKVRHPRLDRKAERE